MPGCCTGLVPDYIGQPTAKRGTGNASPSFFASYSVPYGQLRIAF